MTPFLQHPGRGRPSGPGENQSAAPDSGRIDLWHADLTYAGWGELVSLLSEEERSRTQAFAFERDARRYVVSHAILRAVLGNATGIAAAALTFRRGPDLKPLLDAPGTPPVHFSLSRSEDLVLVGIAAAPLGVDVERVVETFDVEQVQGTALSPREQAALQPLNGPARRNAFFGCWTQKEAFLKATGQGLRTPPDTIEIRIESGRARGLARIAGDARAAAEWLVEPFEPRAGFAGAVAMRGGNPDIRLTATDTASLLRSLL